MPTMSTNRRRFLDLPAVRAVLSALWRWMDIPAVKIGCLIVAIVVPWLMVVGLVMALVGIARAMLA
jgi:hypothetical protein